jgi:hypothetical protein
MAIPQNRLEVRYSPKYLEGAFSEVGFPFYGVLGSSKSWGVRSMLRK